MRAQLAEFDRYFVVTHAPGARIEAVEPVLRADDLLWLSGLEGTVSRTEGDAVVVAYRFLKRNSAAEDRPYHVELWMNAELVEGRLSAVQFQPHLNEAIDIELLRRAFHGVDEGELDKEEGETGWALHRELRIPDRRWVRELMGAPGRLDQTEEHEVYRYEYDLTSHVSGAQCAPDLSFCYVYERGGEALVRARADVGWLVIAVERDAGGVFRVTIRRAPGGDKSGR